MKSNHNDNLEEKIESEGLLEKNLLLKNTITNYLDEVRASSLSDKIKDDCKNILECLLYLNENLTLFKWQVDHNDDCQLYVFGVDKRGYPFDNSNPPTMQDKN